MPVFAKIATVLFSWFYVVWANKGKDFHCINISMLRRPREQRNNKRRRACVHGSNVHGSWCFLSFCLLNSHHLLNFLHTSVLVNISRPLIFMPNCMILINLAWAENEREKTAASFKISMRAPVHELFLLLLLLLLLAHLVGICKCLRMLNSNDMSALRALARWWWIQLVSRC